MLLAELTLMKHSTITIDLWLTSRLRIRCSVPITGLLVSGNRLVVEASFDTS
jgi:hypothetical protein